VDFTLLPIASIVVGAKVSNLTQLTSEILRQTSDRIMTSLSTNKSVTKIVKNHYIEWLPTLLLLI